jgi:hypothetical protein
MHEICLTGIKDLKICKEILIWWITILGLVAFAFEPSLVK